MKSLDFSEASHRLDLIELWYEITSPKWDEGQQQKWKILKSCFWPEKSLKKK